MHLISSYRGNRPTHTHTQTHNPPTNRQDRLQYTVLQLACSVKMVRQIVIVNLLAVLYIDKWLFVVSFHAVQILLSFQFAYIQCTYWFYVHVFHGNCVTS